MRLKFCCEMLLRFVQAMTIITRRTNTKLASALSSSMHWEWCHTKTPSGHLKFSPTIDTVCFLFVCVSFYCAVHDGLAIACHLSVRLSICDVGES